jgi:hypothetical protein
MRGLQILSTFLVAFPLMVIGVILRGAGDTRKPV